MPSNHKISLSAELESNQIQDLQNNPQFKVIHEHQQINKFQVNSKTNEDSGLEITCFSACDSPNWASSFEYSDFISAKSDSSRNCWLLISFSALWYEKKLIIKCTDCRYNNVWLTPHMFLGCRVVALWSLRKLWDLIELYQFRFDFAFHLQAA